MRPNPSHPMTTPIPPAVLAAARRYYDAKTALDIARRCEDGDAEHRARLERLVLDAAVAWAEVSHHHATPLPLADPSTTTSLLDS